MTDLTLQNKFSSLPAHLKAQVMDYIDFLLQRGGKTNGSQELTAENPAETTETKPKFSWQNKVTEEEKALRLEDFNFLKSQEILKGVKGTALSDLLIEERRTGR